MGKHENKTFQGGADNMNRDSENEKCLIASVEMRSSEIILLTLNDPKKYLHLEFFLKDLLLDFSMDDGIKNAFSFQPENDNNRVTITLNKITAEKFLGYIDENNLRPQPENNGPGPR